MSEVDEAACGLSVTVVVREWDVPKLVITSCALRRRVRVAAA
jgi:hypothetical protein